MPRTRTERPRPPCEICGAPIPHKPGMPAKTCGAACAAERRRNRERERYHKIKNTPQWQTTRADYLRRTRERLEADPEYAALFRAYANERSRAWRRATRESPDYEQYRQRTLAEKREERAEWRRRLLDEPMGWEVHKFKARAWYASLSEEDRDRIYYEPARRRATGK